MTTLPSIKQPFTRPWLLSDEDMDRLYEENGDFFYDIFIDNGIISRRQAILQARFIRFEYSHEDCPSCGMIDKHYKLKNNQWKCRKCREKFSIKSKTFIDNSKLEYYQWFRFAYFIGNLGVINSCTISRDLGVTQKTAWLMIDTLKKAKLIICGDDNLINYKYGWNGVLTHLLTISSEEAIIHRRNEEKSLLKWAL